MHHKNKHKETFILTKWSKYVRPDTWKEWQVLGHERLCFSLKSSTVIDENRELSLRSSNEQPPGKYVKCDPFQPRIEAVK